jgi:hypothetical protein
MIAPHKYQTVVSITREQKGGFLFIRNTNVWLSDRNHGLHCYLLVSSVVLHTSSLLDSLLHSASILTTIPCSMKTNIAIEASHVINDIVFIHASGRDANVE